MNQKKLSKLRKRKERERNQNPKGIILSLYKPNANEFVNKYFDASIFVQEVPRIHFTKFGIITIATFTNVLLIGITMTLIKIQTKGFENIKQMLWKASTLHKLPIHTLIIPFENV